MKTTVSDRQSLLDIALQTGGSIESVFVLAARNGLDVTDTLFSGMVIEHDNVIDKQVLRNYQTNGIRPATATDLNNRIFDNSFDLTFN